jgi:hypothetical protein
LTASIQGVGFWVISAAQSAAEITQTLFIPELKCAHPRGKFDNLLNVWYIFYCVHIASVKMKHNNRIIVTAIG